jgi:hypothetical protein
MSYDGTAAQTTEGGDKPMPRTTAQLQQEPDLAKSIEGSARLQAGSDAGQAEWVSAVSYWCDYLTIIDMQGMTDKLTERSMREAS